MTKVRVHGLTMSADGYAAGPDQSLQAPMGLGTEHLHDWLRATRTFQELLGSTGGETGLDDDFAAQGDVGVGASIMGRNMFGPQRGDWPDDGWRGWWGDNPPYHHPVFVLTHHPRPPITMEGGTDFHFVTDGIESALAQARAAAGDADVRIAGGPGTVREYLLAGLVDELHVAVSPVLLGAGEPLLAGLGAICDDLECTGLVSSPAAAHLRFVRRPAHPMS